MPPRLQRRTGRYEEGETRRQETAAAGRDSLARPSPPFLARLTLPLCLPAFLPACHPAFLHPPHVIWRHKRPASADRATLRGRRPIRPTAAAPARLGGPSERSVRGRSDGRRHWRSRRRRVRTARSLAGSSGPAAAVRPARPTTFGMDQIPQPQAHYRGIGRRLPDPAGCPKNHVTCGNSQFRRMLGPTSQSRRG